MLGLAARETQLTFVEALERSDRRALLETIDTLAERGKDLEIFLGDVVLLLRERIANSEGSADRDVALARGLLAVRADLFRALDRQIRMEIGVLALADSLSTRPPSTMSPSPARATRAPAPTAKGNPSAAPGTSARKPAAETAAPLPGHASPVAEREAPPPLPPEMSAAWSAMLREVEKDRIAIAAYLTEAVPSLDGTLLVLSFHPEHTFHKDSLEKNENMQYVAGAVRRHFGDSWRVDVRYDKNIERKALPRELLLEKARLVCQVFDGRIVKEAS
jgi:DNA polymerase III gamma/tau subunit